METTAFNWVDFALIVMFFFYLRDGYRRGFFALFLDLIGFTISLVTALALYQTIGQILSSSFGLARPFAAAAGFLLVWTVMEFSFPFLEDWIFDRFPDVWHQKISVRWAGLVPATIQAAFLSALILSLVIALPFPPLVKGTVLNSEIGSVLVNRASLVQYALGSFFGDTTRDSLAFLTVEQGTTELIDLEFSTDEFHPNTEIEFRMLNLINAERAQHGLQPLTFDSTIITAARLHSADMLTRGYFSHITPEGKSPSERAKDVDARFIIFGENLAFAPDVTIAHDGLMNSSKHRANILSAEYSRVGIGIQDAGVYGLMITQNFAD